MIPEEQLADEMRMFMEQVLRTTTRESATLRNLNTAISYDEGTGIGVMNINGNVMVLEDSDVTGTTLEGALITYFKFFGSQDLQTYMKDAGLDISSVTVAVEGNVVSAGTIEQRGIGGDDSGPSTGVIAGIAAAGAAALAVAVYWIFRSPPASDDPNETVRVVGISSNPSSPGRSSTGLGPQPAEASPPNSPGPASLSGMVSLEDSLFTTDNSTLRGPPSTYQYDASRLDKVIYSAKGLSG